MGPNEIDWATTKDLISLISTIVIALTAIGLFIFNGISIRKLQRSIEVTKEKEKTDRALNLIDKYFEECNFHALELIKIKGEVNFKTINLTEDKIKHFNNVLSFFNLAGSLIISNRADEDLIRKELGDFLVVFFSIFNIEIEKIVTEIYKLNNGNYYNLDSYFEICERFNEKINHFTEKELEDIKRLKSK